MTLPLKCPRFEVRVRHPGDGHEAIEVYAGTDHRRAEGSIRLARQRRSCAASTGSATRRFTRGVRKYGGMEVSDARKLKGLEDENARLKKLLAESMLVVSTLKEMLAKNF